MDKIGISRLPGNDFQQQILMYLVEKQAAKGDKPPEHMDSLQLIPFKGTSMIPTLRSGDTLVVVPVAGIIPSPGEIILRRKPKNIFVAHRVCGFDPRRGIVFTRGDSRFRKDAGWRLEKNAGRVIGIWRDGALRDVPQKPRMIRKAAVMGRLFISRAMRRFGILK